MFFFLHFASLLTSFFWFVSVSVGTALRADAVDFWTPFFDHFGPKWGPKWHASTSGGDPFFGPFFTKIVVFTERIAHRFFHNFEKNQKKNKPKCDSLGKSYYFGDIRRRRVFHFLASFSHLVFGMPPGRSLVLFWRPFAPFCSLCHPRGFILDEISMFLKFSVSIFGTKMVAFSFRFFVCLLSSRRDLQSTNA